MSLTQNMQQMLQYERKQDKNVGQDFRELIPVLGE
jgi:hypothetical protein